VTGDKTLVYTRKEGHTDVTLLILVDQTGPIVEEHHRRTSVLNRNPANCLDSRRRELVETGWTLAAELEGWWSP
jgi:hypothetical protein